MTARGGRPVRAAAALVIALVSLDGCSNDSGPTGTNSGAPASITMYLSGIPVTRGAFVGMQVGVTLTFAATVRDAFGHSVSGAHATVASRNPNVISIDSAGTIRAVGRGSTWLVAGFFTPSGGLIADSLAAGLVCTTIAIAGLNVTVSDSLTGAATALTSVSISARSGAFRDSVFYPTIASGSPGAPAFLQGLAYERPGSWDIRVTADGYKPWAALGVVVGTDLCHVVPVALSARLQRS